MIFVWGGGLCGTAHTQIQTPKAPDYVHVHYKRKKEKKNGYVNLYYTYSKLPKLSFYRFIRNTFSNTFLRDLF